MRKTRIDELPQLINVLKGDMSLVGPRPERPEIVKELATKISFYELRHYVKPGVTGWAQICYSYGSTVEDSKEKLEYDLYYLKNYSVFLDMVIIFQTIGVIFWGKGAR
jgi:lipopolysaccharide/colanic/teichoic acid biosynthesis glycosyltransferase